MFLRCVNASHTFIRFSSEASMCKYTEIWISIFRCCGVDAMNSLIGRRVSTHAARGTMDAPLIAKRRESSIVIEFRISFHLA